MKEITDPIIESYKVASNLCKELTSKLGKKVTYDVFMHEIMDYRVTIGFDPLEWLNKQIIYFPSQSELHVYRAKDTEIARRFGQLLEEKNMKVTIIKHFI